MIHENPPHELRGDPEEVRAIPPLYTALIDKSQIRLVYERRGLERVSALLSPHRARCLSVELGVHLLQEPFAGGGVTAAPGEEESGDVARCTVLRRRRGVRRPSHENRT
jgi:hypothetical protein